MLRWRKIKGGWEASGSPANTLPGKAIRYAVSGHSFLGMKTNVWNVTRGVGFSMYPETIAARVASADVAKAAAQADHDRRGG